MLLGSEMAAGADFSPPFAVLEEGGCKDNGTGLDEEKTETFQSFKQVKVGKPPRHVLRHSISTTAFIPELEDMDGSCVGLKSPSELQSNCLPIFRSGSWAEKGPKQYMEDEHICIDNLVEHLGEDARFPSPGAFYGVFDGHGGVDAALYIRRNILKFIVEDNRFPTTIDEAIKSAYLKADHAFADAHSLDSSSGTTALTALIFGRTMLVANAGDCRAVLGKRGRAIELSRDHKPNCGSEKLRIEKLGGVVYDGYLNGQLSVARAIGDWHMKGTKGVACPLSAEPELQEAILTEEDEFLILGCDGIWDVMSSQYAVTIVRKELMLHNDPQRCSQILVREALKRDACDNLTVVVVCFSPDPPPRIEVPKFRVRRSISAEGLNFLQGVLDGSS